MSESIDIPDFIEPHIQIKHIRESLNLTQSDVSDSEYTQVYVSYIESGKFPLTKNFIRHFIKIANKRGSLSLRLNDFRYSLKDKVESFLASRIPCSDMTIADAAALEISLQKNMKYLAEDRYFFYMFELGKFYYRSKEFHLAKSLLYRLLPDTGSAKDLIILAEYTLYLTRLVFAFTDYTMLNDFEPFIIKKIDLFDNFTKEKIYCNVINIYYLSRRYTDVFEMYKRYQKSVALPNLEREIGAIYALAHKESGNYDQSYAIYKSLLTPNKRFSAKYNTDTKIWMNLNILEVEILQSHIQPAEYRFKLLRKLLKENGGEEDFSKVYYRKRMIDMGNAALFLKKTLLAKEYFLSVIETDEIFIVMDSDIDIVIEAIKKAVPLLGKKDIPHIEQIQRQYFSLYKLRAENSIFKILLNYYESYKFTEHKKNLLDLFISLTEK